MYHRVSAVAGTWSALLLGLLLWGALCLTGWMIFTSGGGPIGGTGVPVFIDSGSTTSYLDTTGVVWSFDADVTGGVYATSTAPVTNTADAALFQSFRTAPTGDIVYAIPIAGGGLFQVSELEAELSSGFVKGSRIQNISLACDGVNIPPKNGVLTAPLHGNFDILDPAGPCGGNTAVGRACTVTDWVSCGSVGDSTNHTLSITFGAVSNQAQVNAIRVIPNAQAIIPTPTMSPTSTPPPLNALGPQIVSCAGGVATGADVPLTVTLSPGEGLVLLHRGNPTSPSDPGVSDSLGNTWTLDTGVAGLSVNGPSSGCLNVDYVTSPIGKGTGGSDVVTAKSPGTGLPNLAVVCEMNDFGGLDAANGVGLTPYTTTVSASSVTPQLTLDTLLGIFDVEVPSGGATPALTGSPVNSVGAGTPQDVTLLGTPSNSTFLVGAPAEQGVLQNTVAIQQGATPAGNFCGGLTALAPVVAFVGRSQGIVPTQGGPVMTANDFLNTMGVNTGQTQSNESTAQIQAEVEYLGIRNIRDDQTNCLNHTTDVLGNPVNYCSGFNTLIDYCNDHNGTVNVTVGTPITGTNNLTAGASNPYGVMVNMLPDSTPSGAAPGTYCDSANICMTSNKAEFDYLAQCGIAPATRNIIPFIEGLNEPENDGHLLYRGANCGDNSTDSFAPCAAYMNDLWKLVHGQTTSAPGATTDTILPALNLKVSACTQCGTETDNACLQYLTVPSGITCVGVGVPGTQFADIAGLHNYFGGAGAPFDNITWLDFSNALGTGGGSAGGQFDNMDGNFCHQTRDGLNGLQFPATGYPQCNTIPKNTTETGWGSQNISPSQAGKLALNGYLSAAAWGMQHMFWYMSVDGPKAGPLMTFFQANPAQQPNIKPWPAGIFVHNLTSILSDITSAFTTTAVNVTTSTLPATVHTLLLEKSNGKYEYAIWDDRPEGEITGENVTVTLPQPYSTVNVYDPTLGTAVITSLSNVSSVQVTLNDHPNIIEFYNDSPAPIPTLGPSPTPIPAPSASPTPFATPIPGAPTVSDFSSYSTNGTVISQPVFPTVKPPNGSTLVLIAGENYNPSAGFVVPTGFTPLLSDISQTTTITGICGGACANDMQAWCKMANNETGGGYTVSWNGGANGSGYVTTGLIVLQGTSCSKVEPIQTVIHQGLSATIPAVTSSSTDIVLTAAVAVGGTAGTNVTVTGFGLNYNQLWDWQFNQTGIDYWLPTNTLGPTVVLMDNTRQAGFLGMQIAFHP